MNMDASRMIDHVFELNREKGPEEMDYFHWLMLMELES